MMWNNLLSHTEPELDKTFEMKAWRINMKASPSKEKSNDSTVRNDTAVGSVVESGNDKPWRHNMKKSLSAEDDMGTKRAHFYF